MRSWKDTTQLEEETAAAVAAEDCGVAVVEEEEEGSASIGGNAEEDAENAATTGPGKHSSSNSSSTSIAGTPIRKDLLHVVLLVLKILINIVGRLGGRRFVVLFSEFLPRRFLVLLLWSIGTMVRGDGEILIINLLMEEFWFVFGFLPILSYRFPLVASTMIMMILTCF